MPEYKKQQKQYCNTFSKVFFKNGPHQLKNLKKKKKEEAQHENLPQNELQTTGAFTDKVTGQVETGGA